MTGKQRLCVAAANVLLYIQRIRVRQDLRPTNQRLLYQRPRGALKLHRLVSVGSVELLYILSWSTRSLAPPIPCSPSSLLVTAHNGGE